MQEVMMVGPHCLILSPAYVMHHPLLTYHKLRYHYALWSCIWTFDHGPYFFSLLALKAAIFCMLFFALTLDRTMTPPLNMRALHSFTIFLLMLLFTFTLQWFHWHSKMSHIEGSSIMALIGSLAKTRCATVHNNQSKHNHASIPSLLHQNIYFSNVSSHNGSIRQTNIS